MSDPRPPRAPAPPAQPASAQSAPPPQPASPASPAQSAQPASPARQPLADAIQLRAERQRQAEQIPSVARNLGQIGILGLQIVLPGLLGLALGHWLDHRLTGHFFWTASLLIIGLALGCWSGWRWMHHQ